MNQKRAAALIFAIGVIFHLSANRVTGGWGLLPTTVPEVICDGIACLMYCLAIAVAKK